MIKPDYTPRIAVLHIEDDRETAERLHSELIKKNIYVYNVTNLEDAVKTIKKM